MEKLVVERFLSHEKDKKLFEESKPAVVEESSQPENVCDISSLSLNDEEATSTSKRQSLTLSTIMANSQATLFADDVQEETEAVIDPSEKEMIQIVKCEIVKYKEFKRLDLTADPFDWWKRHSLFMPSLSKVAARYLSSPPSSVESERTFSIGGNIITKERTKLRPENTEQMIFLNENLPLLDIQDYSKLY